MRFEELPLGTQVFILAKNYYSVLNKRLESLEVERYYSIILYINNNPGCTQQMVCDALKIDKTAMVKIIDYLDTEQYVYKTINPKNRRQHQLFLTDLGIKRSKTIQMEFEALDELLLSKCSDQVKIHFFEGVSTMADCLASIPSNPLSFNYKKAK